MASPPLTDWLHAGRYFDVLLSKPAAALIDGFVKSLQQQQPSAISKSSATTPSSTQVVNSSSSSSTTSKPDDHAAVSAHDRLTVGLAALNSFLQANVTGPVLEGKGMRLVEQRFLSSGRWKSRELRRACLKALEVDGVECYEHVPMVEVFGLARHLLLLGLRGGDESVTGEGTGAQGAARSRAWLALRVNVWHYKLLTQPSLGPGSIFNKSASWCDVPSLQGEIEKGLDEVAREVLDQPGWATALDKVQFLVEKANVCIMLGQDVKAKEALQRATAVSGFAYALSGALGKRTRFQEKSTSQLVVLAKSGGLASADSKATSGETKPQALSLNDDTLLENLEFTKEKEEGEQDAKSGLPVALRDLAPDEQPQLSPLDQIILLGEATLKDAFSPADTLTSEEVLPFAVRVISDKSTNWQIYTHALLVRSRIEVHRSRTLERGILQMQAVVDQVVVDTTQPAETSQPDQDGHPSEDVPEIQITSDDNELQRPANKPTSFFPAPKPTETAPAQVRLEYIHALSSPPRWHLESELAYSWAGVGSLVSALEIFKRLRLWAEVALCFASSAAQEDEDGRGSNGEAKAKAVLRWRLFHKAGTPAEQQATSDSADDEADLDDLKESDYHGPERQPPPPNAPRLWCILGDIENDPRHYERAWELSKHRFARAQRSLGEYYLQQKDLQQARDAYKKAVAVNRLSSELWNRLGDISLRLGDFSDAAEAFGRAIASADNIVGGEDARTWSNLGSALYSLYVERVKELKQQREQEGGTSEAPSSQQKADDDNNAEAEEEDDINRPADVKPPQQRDPSTLLAQSLAAYKRGANIAHDNWRIWDNVITLAARLRPVPVADLLLALRSVVRIRRTEDALDTDVLRLLLNEAVLSQEAPSSSASAAVSHEDLPRGTPQRAVCEFVETDVVPLITTRSELWELVTRERVWRREYAGAVDAAERAWRAAVGGSSLGVGGGGGLVPSGGGGGGGGASKTAPVNWLEDREGWKTVVERTDELVSMLENYGVDVAEIGAKWKGKARSAVRSVMGKAKESWKGSEEWERLVALLEGLR